MMLVLHVTLRHSVKSVCLTVVCAADLEPADAGEHGEVGQTAQAKQNATEGVGGARRFSEQPPDPREKQRRTFCQ